MTPSRRLVAILLSSIFTAVTLPMVTAADAPSTEKTLPALPLTATFGKGTPGENSGPMAVTLKNTSAKAITVTATVNLSVKSHNRAATVNHPPHEIAAGGTWTINDLAFDDKITLTAEGFQKLELTTPAS